MDDFKISLGTQLDTSNIPKQVLDLQKKLNAINIKVDFNDSTLKQIEDKISKVSSNIQLTTNATDVAKNIQDNINKATQNVKPQVNVSLNIDKANSTTLLQKNIDTLKNSIKATIPVDIGADNTEIQQKIKNLQIQMQTQLEKYGKIDMNVDQTAFDNFTESLNSMNADGLRQAQLALNQIRNEFQLLNAQSVSDLPQNAIENMNSSLAKMPSIIQNINTNFSQLTNANSDLSQSVSGLAVKYKEVNDMSVGSDKIKAYAQLKTETQRVTAEINSQLSAQKLQVATENQYVSVESRKAQILSSIGAYYSKNTKLISSNKDEAIALVSKIEELRSELSQATDSSQVTALNRELSETKNLVTQAGLSGRSLGDSLKSALTNFTTYFSISKVVNGITNAFKSMVSEVVAVDTAMTNLRKVTDATDTQFNAFLDTAIQKSQELGSSLSDLIDATSEFARLGYNITDATQLGEIATLYKNVGDGLSASDASQNIISTMKAFNIEASDAITIIDKLNEVGNHYAISSAGIGEALRLSASAMSEANNDLSESIGLIVGANNVVQDPNSVGTAWKTISMRIRGAVEELEDAGLETDGMTQSTSELNEMIKTMTGFSIFEDDNQTFKSTYDIIVGISDAYNNLLTDAQQASLLEALAGKRQGNILASALNNVDDIKNAYESAENSAGSAMAEQEKYAQSAQYSIDRLQASLQELSVNTLNSDSVKWFVDVANGAVNLTDKIGLLNIALIALSGLAGAKKGFGISVLANSIDGMITKMGVASTTATTLSMALSAMIPTVAVIGGVTAIVKIYDALNVSLEEQQEKLENARNEYTEQQSQLSSITLELETQRQELERLNNLDTPTYADEAEIEKLKQVTEQLQIQEDLATRAEQRAQKSLATEAVKTTEKQFGNVGSINLDKVQNYESNADMSGNNAILLSDSNDISSMLAGYEQINKLLQQTTEEYNNLTEAEKESYGESMQMDIANYEDLLASVSDSVFANTDVLSTQQEDMQSYYDTLKDTPYEDLTSEQKSVVDSYNAITNAIKTIYTILDPSKLEEFSSAQGSVADSSDKLAQSTSNLKGELNSTSSLLAILENTTISGYVSDFTSGIKTINSSLSDLDDIAGNASEISSLMTSFPDFDWASYNLDDVESLKQALNDLADKELKKVLAVLDQYDNASGLTEQFSKMADSVHGLKEEIKGFNDVVSDMSVITGNLSEINDAFSEFAENGNISYDTIVDLQSKFGDTTGWQDFVNIATKAGVTTNELDSACDTLIDTYIRESGVLDDVTLDTVDLVSGMLKEKGVVNSLEVVLSSLGLTTEAYGKIVEYCKEKGIELSDVTLDEITQLVNLDSTSQDTKVSLAQYALQKEIANGITISTDGDIQNLINLVKACGSATTALTNLARAKSIYEDFKSSANKPLSLDMSKVNEQLSNAGDGIGLTQTIDEYYNSLLEDAEKEVQSALNGLSSQNGSNTNTKSNYDYTSSDTYKEQQKKKTSTSSKDKTTEINNIEQALKLLENQVDKTESALSNLESNGSDDYYTDKKKQIEALNESLTTLSKGYQNASDSYNTLYEKQLGKLDSKTASKARKMIESGSYDVSTFDSDTAEIINKAKDYYNDSQDYSTKIAENQQKIKENTVEINKSELERLGILQETGKLYEESATNTKDKNDAIDYQIAVLQQQSKLEQANAKSEEEANKIRLDFEQQIAEKRQTKHQNKADDFQSQYDSLESQKDDAQNYKDKNKLIDEQLKLRKKIYNQEIQTVTTEEEKNKLLEQYNADVDVLTNSKLKNQIDAKEKLASLQQDELSNLEKQIELKNQLSGTDNTVEDYNELISKAKKVQLIYQNLYESKKKEMELDLKNGEYKEYDDKWYEGYETLGTYKSAIDSCTQSIIGYNDEAEKVTFTNFEKGIDKLNNLNSELSDLRDMINDDNLIDSSGNRTADGNSAILLDGKMLANNKAQIQTYTNMIEELQKKYNSGAVDAEYYMSKLNEYQSAQRSLAKENQSIQKDITSIKIASINAITEAYEKQVDLMNEEIDTAEELRKKQKETQEDNLEIAKLQAKIAKLSSSDSAKDQATARELQNTLNEKMAEKEEQQLQDTAQAKKDALSDSLDSLKESNDAEIESIQKSSDKQEQIVNEMLGTIQTNYSSTMANIGSIVSENSLSISESLSSPWVNGQTAIQEYITLAQQAMSVSSNYGGVGSSSTYDQIKAILSKGSGQGKGTSDLNQAITSEYGSQLSYEQMSQIGNILSLGKNLTADDLKGNTDLKNNILAMLRSLGLISSLPHFASGGVVQKFKGNDDGLAYLKAGEGVLNLKEMSAMNNLKPAIPALTNLTDTLKNVNFKGGSSATLDIQNLINIEGDVNDQSMLDSAIDKCRNEVIPIINDYLRKQY